VSGPLRVLAVTSDPPQRPTSGYSIRNHHIIKRLAARHRVWVLAYGSVGDARDPLRDAGVELRLVPWTPPWSKRLRQLASVFTIRSHLGGILHTRAMQQEIDRIMAEVAFDVVLLEGSLLTRFDFGETAPIVLDEHNVEHNLLRRASLVERSLLRKTFGYVERWKFRREEQAACRRAAWCTFTSALERDLMERDVPLAGSAVIPNGVDLAYFQPARPAAGGRGIVFTGRMDYRPNTDAVLHFVRDILPLIRRAQPDVAFTVVGGGAPAEVKRVAADGIVLTGVVPDVRPYLRDADVVVAPIRFGAGTRLKVLEALAMARPLVSTAVGCEGIDVVSAEHLLIADSPRDFAGAVVRLLASPDAAASLGHRGRELVEERYGWDQCGALMQSVLEEVVALHGRDGARRARSRRRHTRCVEGVLSPPSVHATD
jgi:glycosyltransferase involved in cell wall biosynthesis